MLPKLNAMLGRAAARVLRLHAVRRFAQGEDGVAAIEFALIAAPFLALLFAIIETGAIFFTTQVLEKATADAGRLIMTGQQQSVAVPSGSNEIVEFKKKLCFTPPPPPDPESSKPAITLPFIKCDSLSVEVLSASSSGYSSGSTTNAKLGGPGCIVTVQVTYQWPVYVSILSLSYGLAGGKWDGKHQLKATAVFRNEPYGNPTGC
jgi:Flp pilus assembly protein TadG